jgi:pilus assembly protein Flp/PilA
MIKFRKMIRDNKGATAIEYGLIAALIAVAAVGAMQGLGGQVSATFNKVKTDMGGTAATTTTSSTGGSTTSSTSTGG